MSSLFFFTAKNTPIPTKIAAAAEKYGGSAQASDNGKEFYVDVMLEI